MTYPTNYCFLTVPGQISQSNQLTVDRHGSFPFPDRGGCDALRPITLLLPWNICDRTLNKQQRQHQHQHTVSQSLSFWKFFPSWFNLVHKIKDFSAFTHSFIHTWMTLELPVIGTSSVASKRPQYAHGPRYGL